MPYIYSFQVKKKKKKKKSMHDNNSTLYWYAYPFTSSFVNYVLEFFVSIKIYTFFSILSSKY